MMSKYWLVWFILSFSSFLVPETVALATRHPENTLSDAIWRMESFMPGQSVMHWHAGHILFAGVFILVSVWLTGHFVWGLWR